MVVVVTTRKLRNYFQGHLIIIKTNYPVNHILKKPDLAEIMVSWAIELSKYDIMFESKSALKSHLLSDFLVKLSLPTIVELIEE